MDKSFGNLTIENNKKTTITNSYVTTLTNNGLVDVTNSIVDTINANKSKVTLTNSYVDKIYSNLNTLAINSKIGSIEDSTAATDKITGDKFEAQNSEITGRIYQIDDVTLTDSKASSIGHAKILNSTNSHIVKVDFIDNFVANQGRIETLNFTKSIDFKGTATNKIILDNLQRIDEGTIDHAIIDNIYFVGSDYSSENPKFVTISNSLIKASNDLLDNSANNLILHNTEVQGVMTNYHNLKAYASKFKNNINTKSLILKADANGKKSEFNSSNTIRTKKYEIDNLDTGKVYNTSGEIIGEGNISNSLINMQISGFSDSYIVSDKYLKEPIVTATTFYGALNDSNVTLDNVVATNNARAGILNINNSKIAKRVLANSLTSNNTAYYLGANKESYTGAIISRENTSGANNELVLLNVMSDNKLDTSKINANLPLAILKKGTGTAELNTFFKDYKISDGISDYVINNDYVASAMLGDYLTYAITTNKNGKVSDTGLNADNIVSIANGDKTSALGKLVNQSSSDMDSEVLDLYLNNLANSNYVSNTTDETPNQPDTNNPDTGVTNPENPSNPDTGVTNPDNKPDNSKPDTGVTNPDTGVTNPDTGVTNPDNKPDNKPDTSVTNPIDKNQIADDFIKDIKINKNAKAQAQVISKGINLINTFAWNNMNKRLGEIRGLDKELGVWARAYYTNASIDDVKLNSFEVQFGADKANNFADGNVITGIMANISNSKSSDVLKGNNYGFGLYTSYISNNDLYADLVIKANHYKVKYNSELLKGLKDSKTGFIASFELGKRFDLNRFYVEPSIEAIFDYTPKTNLENNAISITSKANSNLHIKPAVFSGFKVNDNANIRLGAGYIIDVNKPSDSIIIAKSSKASEIIEGKRDNKFYLNLTGDYKFNDNLRLNLGYERTFGADFNIDNQINAVVRYTF
ncbi:autotransporter outer membrane beta-barrel domain-containing protein [Campylobacter sp. 2018MI01]|uniref:autotransporter outer membrane beta-barrel domain-containing protein n=1 Tax=Campylobacter sp. 2018MI01 TaxID=2836735 RepID=UPI001BD9F56B|nr:autotransporter outer membrane beta-barrel domain-containing protein [Campylobacter sp. 2018MI01]